MTLFILIDEGQWRIIKILLIKQILLIWKDLRSLFGSIAEKRKLEGFMPENKMLKIQGPSIWFKKNSFYIGAPTGTEGFVDPWLRLKLTCMLM